MSLHHFLGKLHFVQILLSASCLFCVLGFFMSEMNLVHPEPVVPSSFSLLPAKIIHVLGLHVFLCIDFLILPVEKKMQFATLKFTRNLLMINGSR